MIYINEKNIGHQQCCTFITAICNGVSQKDAILFKNPTKSISKITHALRQAMWAEPCGNNFLRQLFNSREKGEESSMELWRQFCTFAS